MIVVSISSTDITVDGHAGYAEPGKDIICSAVTILTFNLIKSIESLTGDKIKYKDDTPNLEGRQTKVVYDSLPLQSFLDNPPLQLETISFYTVFPLILKL